MADLPKVNRQNIEDMLNLTSLQKGMLFHYLHDTDSLQYFEQLSLELDGKVDIERFRQAWNRVIEMNEMLRTVFRWTKIEHPVQLVLRKHSLDLRFFDCRGEKSQEMVEQVKIKDRQERFDLRLSPFRISLCQMTRDSYVMILSFHHIIVDGWSLGVILREFISHYSDTTDGVSARTARGVKRKFKDFIKWQQQQDHEQAKVYWSQYLAGYEGQKQLQLKLGNQPVTDLAPMNYQFALAPELVEQVQSCIQKKRMTLATFLYTAWGLVLQQYLHAQDLLFGYTVSGRNAQLSGIEDMVGLFINTLPLRFKTDPESTIETILTEMNETLQSRMEYENTALTDIKSYLGSHVSDDLFNTIVVIENYPLEAHLQEGNDFIIPHYSIFEQTNYDLTVGIKTFQGIQVDLMYHPQVFDLRGIQQLGEHFLNAILWMLHHMEQPIRELDLLSTAEKEQLLHFSQNLTPYPETRPVHRLIEEQAMIRPDAVAVVHQDTQLTYRELNTRANQIATYLRAQGVQRESIVAIMVEPSLEMISGILGIFKAGGAYLPIDPQYPEKRISYMLEDSGVEIILTQQALVDKITPSLRIMTLDDQSVYQIEHAPVEPLSQPDDLAYIIYTSGSTGQPKGVMIEHKALLNYTLWHQAQHQICPTDRASKYAGFGFDASVLEIFPYLVAGASLYMIDTQRRFDLVRLNQYFEEHQITVSFLPTQICEKFMELENRSLRLLLTGGDTLHRFSPQPYTMVNNYGPTENTIVATSYPVDENRSNIPIGRPIANVEVAIFDPFQRVQPVGVVGELYLGGAGLARGYLHRLELTTEKFITVRGKRYYRTGDLGRWLPDGNIEFVGRCDSQVKVRGVRIELGEIENQMLNHPSVKEAVVQVREDASGEKIICAYLTTDRELDVTELKDYLAMHLSEHMLPAYYIQLDQFPLTTNGKIDHARLARMPLDSQRVTDYVAPTTEMEERLVTIWGKVLGINGEIGVNSSFFDLGGHSLNAMTLVSQIYKELEVEMTLADFFQRPTIKEQADYLSHATQHQAEAGIESVQEVDFYPQSSAQKRMFLLNQFDSESTTYNIQTLLELEGEIDRARLTDAFQKLIQRHEALRTSFTLYQGEPIQIVHSEVHFELEELQSKEADASRRVQEFVRPFDLQQAPLIRVGLICLHKTKHLMVVDLHHIIADGVSIGILINDLTKIYAGEELAELTLQYKDFAIWQKEVLAAGKLDYQKEFWLKTFEGDIPVLNLPTDFERPSERSFEGYSFDLHLSRKLTDQLHELSRKYHATLFMVLLSAYNVLLYRYTGQNDIVVGTPIASRTNPDTRTMVGMFVNTLAIRSDPTGDKSFEEFLYETRLHSLHAFENQDYQFEDLVDQLKPVRDTSRNPLFDTLFVLQNMEIPELKLGELQVKKLPWTNHTSKFDLTISAMEEADGLKMTVEYCTRLFTRERMERLRDHFQNLLQGIARDPKLQLKDYELLTLEEKRQILVDFNNTAMDQPTDRFVYQLFEEQVAKTPQAVALVYGDERLTYQELNQQANQIAHHLRAHGVDREKIVAIMTRRSFDMVSGILGILKAGGAYLPIDPNYPEKRIQYLLENSGAVCVLVQDEWAGQESPIPVLHLSERRADTHAMENPSPVNEPSDLAYVIYTSGSTGEPKGVQIEHQSMFHLLYQLQVDYPLTAEDAYLLKTSYTFDVSVTELFGWFFAGGRLVILENDLEKDPAAILEVIAREQVTHINFTPSMLANFVKSLPQSDRSLLRGVKYIFSAGEALPQELAKQVMAQLTETRVENLYGPTENTVYTTRFSLRDLGERGTVPIGKPFANIRTYILGEGMQLQPIGVPGELYIAGAGLARGYLNQPELTKAVYVEDAELGERLYKTGDLVSWLPDGHIQYWGRMDQQVKIRGFRIELGEIENNLLRHPVIREATVVVRRDQMGDDYLVAFFVGSRPVNSIELREYLAKELPAYMIPAYFMQLKEMPKSASGKTERKVLPQTEKEMVTGAEYVPLVTETQKKLARIWKEVLGLQGEMGQQDNFFVLGGHSLKATFLKNQIQSELGVEISLKQIFQKPVLKDLASYIDQQQPSAIPSLEPIEKQEYYPISSDQKRMLVMGELDVANLSYNMFNAVQIDGALDQKSLEKAFYDLIQRHEALRTSFHLVDGDYVQQVHDQVEFAMLYLQSTEEDLRQTIESAIRPFDFSRAPLLEVTLVQINPEKHALVLNVHHIISDGTSISILLRDLLDLYAGKELPQLRLQYKDFTHWQLALHQSGVIQKQKEYWLERFAGEIPILHLPTDYPRPAIQTYEGEKMVFRLDVDLTRQMRELTSRTDTTLYMVLLAAYNLLLFKYSGQTDIVVGASIAGRNHPDLQNVMGMLVNALAMRNQPENHKSFHAFLQEVKENALAAYENQDYQFEELVDHLRLPRDLSRNPLFNTMFDLQNMSRPNFDLTDIQVSALEYEEGVARFDLEFNFSELDDELVGVLQYSTRLFQRSTMERLLKHFQNILLQVTNDPDVMLGDVDLLTMEEREQIVFDFNQTEREFPQDQTVIDLFEARVAMHPDKVAVVFEGECITYHQLGERVNQLTGYLLHEYGLQSGDLVAIMMDRSIDMLVSILGIFKAGGAYVPIDATYPAERIKVILDDAQIQLVIGQKRYIRGVNRLQWECSSFNTFLCIDSWDVYSEDEVEKVEAMDEKLWEYVGETATDEITGGGWISSYTGEPFSKKEMDEYGDNVLKKLQPYFHQKTRVLEIGCASGITMFRIAPHVGFYYGTDLSKVIIEKNRRRVEEEGHENIALAAVPMHEIDQITEGDFDLIIINSVIQDFHGHNYLRKGIRKLLDRMSPRGHLFIGDVMDQDMKANLVADLVEFRRANREKNYRTKVDWSAELFVSRPFFSDLAWDLPAIRHVEFSEKIYTIENELTRYRYDVLLTIDKENPVRQPDTPYKRQHDLRHLTPFTGIQVANQSRPESLAYVIYTSGSTGKPKGAMVEEIGMVNHLFAKIHDLHIDEQSIVAQNSSHCFDISVWQFLVALMVGGQTVIYPNELILNPGQFMERVVSDRITILEVVPSYLMVTLDQLTEKRTELSDLKYLLVTGETLKHHLVKGWLEKYPEIPLVNAYGPTEASDDITHHIITEIPEDERISIGKPVQNFTIYIVNDHMQLCPIGVKGEICVSGIGVGRGYIHDAEKTARVFTTDPFRPDQKIRLYKTGDIGAWNADGSIAFFGRKDYQVKIRGFRIELGEIERKLIEFPGVKEAVVIDREDPSGNKHLYAYVVSHTGEEIVGLRDFLMDRLPDYMVPAQFIQLETLPLNSNGKIDRKALPIPGSVASTNAAYVAPTNSIEEKLAEIWAEVLGIEQHNMGTQADFFELGGHSLKAIGMTARIHKILNVEVPLSVIFEKPTIQKLARYIQQAGQSIFQAIEEVEEQDDYPLSSAQKRLYILQQMEEESITYNMPGVALLEGELDFQRLEHTFQQLTVRHEALRTQIEVVEGQPMQKVLPEVDFRVHYDEASEEEAGQIIQQFVRPFDLSQAPLLRLGLIRLALDRHILLMDVHHIISDGVSEGILMKEFMHLYNGDPLPELKLQYKDYAVWHNQRKTQGAFQAQEAYWLEEFAGELPVLHLPLDHPRPPFQSFEGSLFRFTLESDETQALRSLAKEVDATLYMVLLGAFQVLLAKLSGQDDIVVGTPVAGRNHPDVEAIVGMFVNTLALRSHPTGNKTFKDFLQEVQIKTVRAFENQEYQFEDLVEQVSVQRDTSRNPVFDVMFMMQNMDIPEMTIPNLRLKPYDFEQRIAKFDLTLSAIEVEDRLELSFEYSTALFERETIQRFSDYYIRLIAVILQRPEIEIASIQVQSEAEQKWLLQELNATQAAYPKDQTIYQLFEAQVEKTPDQIALVSGDAQLTYAELNGWANQWARALRTKGVQPNQLVGVLLDRSFELIVSIMAIMKAGGAYLPIDRHYPTARKLFMLTDSGTEILITEKSLLAENSGLLQEMSSLQILTMDDPALSGDDQTNVEAMNSPEDLAYVIYTSGTTGQPKGAMIEHRGLVNYIWWAAQMYGQGEQAHFPLFTSIAFDLTVTSIFTPLVTGNRVVIYSGTVTDNLIDKIFEDQQVDVVKLTPAHLKLIRQRKNAGSRIKRLIVGGEELESQLAREIYSNFAGQVEIYNEYGPTETVVGCMIYPFDPQVELGFSVPIGLPAHNMQIHLLDQYLQLVPLGVAGEIYIGGIGVGRGYLQRPELTAEKFISNPYHPEGRLYRTGDLARRLPSGEIEFLGRIDQQVKIRGYRIELGEIEYHLSQYQGVQEAVVIDQMNPTGYKYLVAYIVADRELGSVSLKEYLIDKLPEYMIPTHFIQMDHIPLTNNGKLDRQALPAVEVRAGADYVAPENQTEEQLAQIWAEILGVEMNQISTEQSFFEMGGHSLMATTMVARIHKEMNVKITLADIFKLRTIRGLAELIQSSLQEQYIAIQPAEKKAYYAVSSVQRRLYFLQQLSKDNLSYNTPKAVVLEGQLQRGRMEETLSKLIQRHESFRTVFVLQDGEPVQKILDDVTFSIEYDESVDGEEVAFIEQFVRPFDLSQAPLMRIGLVKLAKEKHLLLLDMHHMITDGTSDNIFIAEFLALYSGQELPPMSLQYKDYAEWQNSPQQQEAMKRQERFWLKMFHGEIPVLNLPTDFPRPAVQGFAGSHYNFSLDEELTAGLKNLALGENATLFMVLLTIYQICLAKLSKQEDLVVGVSIAGRRHADVEPIIGMFVNTLALRNQPREELTFSQFLNNVRVNTMQAYENQDYLLEHLVEKVAVKRDPSRNPLFDVMFVLNNESKDKMEIPELKVIPYELESGAAQLDLKLRAHEVVDQIHFTLEYSTDLFRPETIMMITDNYLEIARIILSNKEIQLKDIRIHHGLLEASATSVVDDDGDFAF